MLDQIKVYREYKRLAEEAQAMADAIADEIKAAMTQAGQNKLIVGEYKLSYADCKRTDIDKKALAADHADIYAAYPKKRPTSGSRTANRTTQLTVNALVT